MKQKIENILSEILPRAFTRVVERRNILGSGTYLAITIAANEKEINGVSSQLAGRVDLKLEGLDLEVAYRGSSVFRKPRLEDPREKYLAFGVERIPFRRPKPNEAAVLRAVERFALRYRETLELIISNGEVPNDYDYQSAVAKI